MNAEVRRRMTRAQEALAEAVILLRRAAEEAEPLGGARRPHVARLALAVDDEAKRVSQALAADSEEVYLVCGKPRPKGARCTRQRDHAGDCAADYSRRYRGPAW